MNKTKNKFESRINRSLKRSLVNKVDVDGNVVASKVIFKYEGERIPYVLAGHYTPDFILTTPLGKIYIECKGYFRPEDKRKLAAVKRQHPELDIRILFYAAKEQYIKWATKHGFRYAVEKIPKEWLNGL